MEINGFRLPKDPFMFKLLEKIGAGLGQTAKWGMEIEKSYFEFMAVKEPIKFATRVGVMKLNIQFLSLGHCGSFDNVNSANPM